MRALKGTLLFVLGMLVGIIVFVVAIGGAAYAIATSMTVGELQNNIGVEIVDPDSEMGNKSIWDMAMELYNDVQNVDKLTLRTLKEKYGLPIPTVIGGEGGVDISKALDIPILKLPDRIGEVVEDVKLREIGVLAGVDFESYNIPILTENLDEGVKIALDRVLSSINGNAVTLRAMEDDFGISLGENKILDAVKDAPVSSYGQLLDALQVRELIEIDTDRFIRDGVNRVFVKTDPAFAYEKVDPSEYGNIKEGAKAYIAGVDASGKVVRRELRFVKTSAEGEEPAVYKVDNSSNDPGFDSTVNTTEYYRYLEYTPFDINADYPDTTEFFIHSYINHFVSNEVAYSPAADGYVSLKTIYKSADLASSLNDKTLFTADGNLNIDPAAELYYASGEPQTGKRAEAYGYDGAGASADTRLEEGLSGYLRVHAGASDPALQSIAYMTLGSLDKAPDELKNLKLGELLTVDADAPKILQKLKDYKINDLSAAIDTLALGDTMDIRTDAYVEDPDGPYRYVQEGGYYAFYNAGDSNTHYGAESYSKIDGYVFATEAEIAANVGLYYYDAQTKSMTACDNTRQGPLFVRAEASSKVLQRFNSVTIKDFPTAFSAITLSEVLDIDGDIYEVSQDVQFASDKTYYEYVDGIYSETSDTVPAGDKTYYTVAKYGTAHVMLKKLAFIKIDDIGSRMTEVVNDVYLSDLLSVFEFSSVEAFTGADDAAKWIVSHSPEYNEIGDNGDISRFAYVYDQNGKYYKSETKYYPVDDKLLAPNGEVSYAYKNIADWLTQENIASIITQAGSYDISAIIPYLPYTYYLKDGVYQKNKLALTSYLIAGAVSISVDPAAPPQIRVTVDSAKLANVYYREISQGGETGKTYHGQGLYVANVLSAAGYEAYDPTDPSHCDMQKYLLLENGYFPVADNNADFADTADHPRYYFDFASGGYSQTPNASSNGGLVFVKIAGSALSGGEQAYYFNAIDRNYNDNKSKYDRYSRYLSETIFVTDTNGEYVLQGGKYIHDPQKALTGINGKRYIKEFGYIADHNQNSLGGTRTALSSQKVDYVDRKSVPVLRAFAQNKVKVSNLDEMLRKFTLSDLIEIAPDTMFDNPAFKDATLENISSAVQNMVKDMTIGNILDWGNITTVESNVRAIISDATVNDLIKSIRFDTVKGLYIDMEVLFGIK